ncbi:MAG: hypothetical protein WAP55_00655 [Minisyncoccia bacterium]
MKGVRVRRKSQEDLDGELFGIVQKTARRFAGDIEKLGRRYRRLRVATDSGRLRSQVESSLLGLVLVDGHTTPRRRNHRKFLSKRGAATDRNDWQELLGDDLGWGIVRTMPHDGGDHEILLPGDPDPAKVVRPPPFWRRIIQYAIHH